MRLCLLFPNNTPNATDAAAAASAVTVTFLLYAIQRQNLLTEYIIIYTLSTKHKFIITIMFGCYFYRPPVLNNHRQAFRFMCVSNAKTSTNHFSSVSFLYLTLSPNCTAISFYNSRIFNEHHFYLFISFTSGFPFAQHLQDHQDIFTHLKLLRFDSPCGIKLYMKSMALCRYADSIFFQASQFFSFKRMKKEYSLCSNSIFV